MIAWIFPGQGSQHIGMTDRLTEPAATRTLDEASEMLGWDVRSVCSHGPAELLASTEVSQPAIFAVSVAWARSLAEAGNEPDVIAGHSLGEFAALVASGSLSLGDGLAVVRARAAAMGRAGRARPGGMVAIIGASVETVRAACARAGGVVGIANVNAPGQVVVSGEVEAVARAAEAARSDGARRAIPLPVSVAAHSPLMAEAAGVLRRALDEVRIAAPRIPFVSCVECRVLDDPEEIKTSLVNGLTAPVDWVGCVGALSRTGARRFVEVGPGSVLAALVRRIEPAAEVTAASSDAAIADAKLAPIAAVRA